MHTPEEKHQFTLLRAQGWSIAKIATHLKIPKATIWRWDHDECEILPILKAARFEELQEKYVPTYEEELQQLTAYRDRIRKALGDQDFSSMKPEFLLQMDLQISARLAKFRANLALHAVPEVKPVSLPGCLSHTEVRYKGVEPCDDPAVAGDPASGHDDSASLPAVEASNSASQNGTFRDETPPGSKRDDSPSAIYNGKNGTVPFSQLLELIKAAAKERMAPSGAVQPPAEKPAPPATSATANSHPDSHLLETCGSASQNGTFRDETPPGSKRDGSSSATYNEKNGTVPFSKNGTYKHLPSSKRACEAPDTVTADTNGRSPRNSMLGTDTTPVPDALSHDSEERVTRALVPATSEP